MKHKLLIFIVTIISVSSVFSIDSNSTDSEEVKPGVIRVLEPGVVDYQSSRFIIRIRAWGVSFPQKGQPGYQEAINFTEKELLATSPIVSVKKTFDEKNLKVADLTIKTNESGFSKFAIENGIGWHNEKETSRYGPFVIAQLKAKRRKIGLWSLEYDFNNAGIQSKPSPVLPGMYSRNNQALPQIRFWVTSLGKVHRPGCSFFQRGRGELTNLPKGVDCRICGGRKGK
jgi:endonuclease YncB( thermonuclease family)